MRIVGIEGLALPDKVPADYEKLFSCLRPSNSSGTADKQMHLEIVFQVGDDFAQAGLRDIKAIGRRGKIQALGHGNEALYFLKKHNRTPPIVKRRQGS